MKKRSSQLNAGVLPTAAALLLMVLAACVTEEIRPVEPAARSTLVVTRSENQDTLNWKSEPGVVYQVLTAHSRSGNADWTPLPGAERIVGTGRHIQIRNKPSYGRDLHYRLKVLAVPKDDVKER